MDDKCVFTMCQIGSSRHLFALRTLPCLCFFPPHKQRSDDILQDGIKTQYAVLWGEKHAHGLQTKLKKKTPFPLKEKSSEIYTPY